MNTLELKLENGEGARWIVPKDKVDLIVIMIEAAIGKPDTVKQ